MTPQQDRALNALLSDLIARLAASGGDPISIQRDEFRPPQHGGLRVFEAQYLLSPIEPRRSVICDGCERRCPMEVTFEARRGRPADAFVVCDKRTDIARVPVDMRRLSRWSLSLQTVGHVLKWVMPTSQYPYRLDGDEFWRLGRFAQHSHKDETVDVVLLEQLGDQPMEAGLVIVLSRTSQPIGAGVVALPDLLLVKDGRLSVNRTALRRALEGPREDDGRIACEIRFGLGEILLVNHVTRQRTVLARPNFNSSNDNAFQVLFAKPGVRFTLSELRAAAGDQTIVGLHKLVENLHFEGLLKAVFFRVSKDAIQFRRHVTVGELATHGIDPREIV